MDQSVSIKITSQDNAGIVDFQSASICDADGIVTASEQIKEFINRNQPIRLIFDFEKVKFFSSQVLGSLLEIRAKLKAYDGEVVISAINPQLHRIFRITNLDKIFNFYPDKDSAIKKLSAD